MIQFNHLCTGMRTIFIFCYFDLDLSRCTCTALRSVGWRASSGCSLACLGQSGKGSCSTVRGLPSRASSGTSGMLWAHHHFSLSLWMWPKNWYCIACEPITGRNVFISHLCIILYFSKLSMKNQLINYVVSWHILLCTKKIHFKKKQCFIFLQ